MKYQLASLFAIFAMAISGCTAATPYNETIMKLQNMLSVKTNNNSSALTAMNYYGYNEYTHRAELKSYLGVDPVQTQWCAAFVNSVLEESGITSNVNHKYPLTARAFLDWGSKVEPKDIHSGDVVIFPRGNASWQGHVGFYLRTIERNGVEYYLILGGNQNNGVSIDAFRASRAIGIRRNFLI